MLERDYAMVKNGNCDYKLTVAYDPDPDGISLDEEIQSLLSEMFNIAESYNSPWKPISTRSVVSNGPGRINQAFSVRSSTWPKSQLRADWAYPVGLMVDAPAAPSRRSEDRRDGKACVETCRNR